MKLCLSRAFSQVASSPSVDQSRGEGSSITGMISKDQLPLFKTLPWLTTAIISPFNSNDRPIIDVSI